jgi:hypothetical protein
MLFGELLDTVVVSISQIVVQIPGDELVLIDAAVLHLADGRSFEILVDDSIKRLVELESPSALEIWGDYEDRTGTRLAPWPELPIEPPLHVKSMSTAVACGVSGHWETPTARGSEYIVGATLKDTSGAGLALRTDVDELHIDTVPQFEQYVARTYGSANVHWVR